MTRYELQAHQDMNYTFYIIRNLDNMTWFAGYDFMGSTEWADSPADAYEMGKDEALAMLNDLVAADEPEEVNPADKQYLVKTTDIDDETCSRIMTGREVADLYETDQLAGIYCSIKVWDITDDPRRVSLLDLVEPILENKRWMEREYRDYCENERC